MLAAPSDTSPTAPTCSWHVPLALALLPHIAVGLAALSSLAWIAWIHVSARAGARSPTGELDESEPLLRGANASTAAPAAASTADSRRGTPAARTESSRTGRHLVLEVIKVVLATAVVTTSAVRLVAHEGLRDGEDAPPWTGVYQGGIISGTVSFCSRRRHERHPPPPQKIRH